MRLVWKALAVIVALLLIVGAGAWLLGPRLLDRQTSGTLTLDVLEAPVTVRRDARGVPYIYAQSLPDALRAQGFVVGQDRLFQIELMKRAAQGRLAEIFGVGPDDVILNRDQQSRVIGFRRIAQRQAQVLSAADRALLEAYLEGLNAYIGQHQDDHPIELRLAHVTPERWTVVDALSVLFFTAWSSSANFDAELVAQGLLERLGPDGLAAIAPLAINPDDPDPQTRAFAPEHGRQYATATDFGFWTGPQSWVSTGVGGSNNWAISSARSGASAAIVTNDPHLDVRDLPGFWHPVGIITPDIRAVGVSNGLGGIIIGRNDHIAFGVTNAYADAVDVYIETQDPNNPEHYLEGRRSVPFEHVEEIIRVADDAAEGGFREVRLDVRLTRRGPVISDHGMVSRSNAVYSLRWASAEALSPELGLTGLMSARNVDEAMAAVADIRTVSLNFVVGDDTGRVARRASGAVPIRLRGNGMTPFVVDGEDNWGGFIPAEQMPGELDPSRGWTGSANHMTAPRDYPYVYTTYVAPSYRYRRIQQLLSAPRITADGAWRAQYDTLNLFAQDVRDPLAQALAQSDDADVASFARTLSEWDLHDSVDSIAPTIFQETIRQLARLTFEDELGEELTSDYLDALYVWHERFRAMVLSGASPYFDDVRTPETEDLPALIRRAGAAARDALTERYGADQSRWTWGAVHPIAFRGPMRLTGLAGQLAGNRSVPMPGSAETLLRAMYPYNRPYEVYWSASLRMTADLNDPNKVRAVLPGGVVGRTLNPLLNDQVDAWRDGDEQNYWWFSDQAIAEHTRSTLTLSPGS